MEGEEEKEEEEKRIRKRSQNSALAGLVLIVQTRLASNLEQSSLPCFLSTGIIGVC